MEPLPQNDPWTPFLEGRKKYRNVRGEEIQKEGRKIKAERERQRSMLDKLKQRRNVVCAMLMPREYFTAFPHFELLHTLKESGLI